MKSIAIAAAALHLGSRAYAQVASACPEENVCYSVNIPDATASSGSGDIYFQISAPTSYEWVALGQGSSMTGSNIFVMYTSASGTNVTISPRLGEGHVMPEYDNTTMLELLSGSGVNGSTMVANVRCANCQSWSGGTMDFSSSSTSWIYASKTGSGIMSDDESAEIMIHDEHGEITFDLTKARGGSSSNPFVVAEASTTSTSTNSSSGAASSSSSSSSGGGLANEKVLLMAHAALACIAWVAIFPLGGLLIRLTSFSGLIWVHAAVQGLGYAIFAAGAGIGIYIAANEDYLSSDHAIIGMVLLGIYFFQPATGWLHHAFFKKNGGRGIFSYCHLFVGRAAIILGIINGGLGLKLAGGSKAENIAYGVCAGFAGLVYLASIVYGEAARSKAMKNQGSGSTAVQKGEGVEAANGHE